jgi:peptidoglycan/xylan/chitin deacetylase (PgdA/CDA1 family)
MSLLVLAYHRASPGGLGNEPGMLDRHFGIVASRHANVVPGETLRKGALNVCLSFDDATYDFYAIVFPLLRKHGLRALLAVAPALIRDASGLPARERLAVATQEAFEAPSSGGFCSWEELREMAASEHVVIAAHGYTHVRLDSGSADLDLELGVPRTLLHSRLGRTVDSVVFPYGRFDSRSLSAARKAYRHAFRLGGAINRGWGQGLLYRVGADGLEDPEAPFRGGRIAAYWTRFLWNRARGR